MDDVDYLVEDNARDDFACACSQELEHFHMHQGFTNIRVKGPVTQLTTMMNGDGGCRCKGR